MILLIDPVRHKAAKIADRTILVRPGGDFDLAMGAAALLFERGQRRSGCAVLIATISRSSARSRRRAPPTDWARAADVSVEDVSAVASALAEKPCSIQVGWGMGRRMNGSGIVRALDALCASQRQHRHSRRRRVVLFQAARRLRHVVPEEERRPARSPSRSSAPGILEAKDPPDPRGLGHRGEPGRDAAGLGDGRPRARDARARRRRGSVPDGHGPPRALSSCPRRRSSRTTISSARTATTGSGPRRPRSRRPPGVMSRPRDRPGARGRASTRGPEEEKRRFPRR